MGRLEALVNDLVDVSRIQAGKLELRPEPTDLAALVREVVEAQREAAPSRRLALHLPAALSLPVVADAGRIEQVVTNYLTNALKYSPADHPVAVGMTGSRARHGSGSATRDRGCQWRNRSISGSGSIGLQGVEVQTGTGVGLGLGLYISRMIVERHQGQVGRPSALGQGATFWFTLPLPCPEEESH